MNAAINLIDELLEIICQAEDDMIEIDDCKQLEPVNELIIRKPDDFHLHLRDGPSLPLLVPHVSLVYNFILIQHYPFFSLVLNQTK